MAQDGYRNNWHLCQRLLAFDLLEMPLRVDLSGAGPLFCINPPPLIDHHRYLSGYIITHKP
jgi:hypothetical protein